MHKHPQRHTHTYTLTALRSLTLYTRTCKAQHKTVRSNEKEKHLFHLLQRPAHFIGWQRCSISARRERWGSLTCLAASRRLAVVEGHQTEGGGEKQKPGCKSSGPLGVPAAIFSPALSFDWPNQKKPPATTPHMTRRCNTNSHRHTHTLSFSARWAEVWC